LSLPRGEVTSVTCFDYWCPAVDVLGFTGMPWTLEDTETGRMMTDGDQACPVTQEDEEAIRNAPTRGACKDVSDKIAKQWGISGPKASEVDPIREAAGGVPFKTPQTIQTTDKKTN